MLYLDLLFRFHALRFSFVAQQPIKFPVDGSANILRGAFGSIFKRLACVPECDAVRDCPIRASCAYARIFEPSAVAPGPSGLADWPRPFVFRAAHLDGQSVAPGGRFHFEVNLFDQSASAIGYFALAFAELAYQGLGPTRCRVHLDSVVQLDELGEVAAIVYANEALDQNGIEPPIEFELDARPEAVSHLRVEFLTPTELKDGEGLAEKPQFGILAARARDRISTLRQLYGDGALDLDFQAFAARAALVRMTHCDITTMDLQRRSSRTGQSHGIGGFVGVAEYEGELTEFLPFLQLAQWTGVGRQTVWGKGFIQVRWR